MNRAHARCRSPVSRRSLLQLGSVTVGGLGLVDLLRLRGEASPVRPSGPDTAVIFVWLAGGPPHMETYDMKPDAPAEYRGEVRPIRTVTPGIEVCELLPLHAKVADRFSLIRSISHDFTDHGGGHKRVLTGRIPKSPTGRVVDSPIGGSIIAKVRDQVNRGVPNYLSINRIGYLDSGAAYLGSSYEPFEVLGDPSSADFKVQNFSLRTGMGNRLSDRMVLLDALDSLRRDMDRTGAMEAMDKSNQRAFDLLTTKNARDAFDLSLEDPRMHERYGNHCWGQQALLARRLVEAGSSFITMVLSNPLPGKPRPKDTFVDWDTHAVNAHIFNDVRFRLPYLDQSVSTLIEDIYERGLDKKVMVVVAGEFGRTPHIDYSVGTRSGVIQPGRNHWPKAMSVLVSGGGMRMGQVIGSTNSKGECPKDRPLTPSDLWATIYRHLGIDYQQSFIDHSGRPMSILPFGEPIRELL